MDTTPGTPQAPAASEVRELVISHTPEGGTVLDGVTRADDLYQALRSRGWLYRRSGEDYVLQASKHQPMKRHKVNSTAAWLRETLGAVVHVECERGTVAPEVAEAEWAAVAEVRAARLARSADRLRSLSAAAEAAARRVFDAIPFGQPVLVDHYSGKADRRRRDRAWAQLGRAYELGREAAHTAHAADVAAARTARRNAPVTVANRIERLAAARRRIERAIERDDLAHKMSEALRARLGYRLLSDEAREDYAEDLAHVTGQVEYWTAVRAQQVSDGTATDYGRDTVKPGDLVRVRGQWRYVVRANVKTVAVPHDLGDWTDTTPWHEVQAHIRPGDEHGAHAVFVRAMIRRKDGHKCSQHAARLFPALADVDTAPAADQAPPKPEAAPEPAPAPATAPAAVDTAPRPRLVTAPAPDSTGAAPVPAASATSKPRPPLRLVAAEDQAAGHGSTEAVPALAADPGPRGQLGLFGESGQLDLFG